MTHSERIDKMYLDRLKSLPLPTKNRSEPFILLDMQGDGKKAHTNFNLQVYKNKKGHLTLVTTDVQIVRQLLEGKEKTSDVGKRIILIDDSGWGFPLGGILCGAYDSQTKNFYVKEIETDFFQGEKYQNKLYLDRYKERAVEILNEIKPNPTETIIKICTGYVNTKAKDILREMGFLVEAEEIGEPLQSWLESQHKEYVIRLIGTDIYYDPKETSKPAISRKFNEVIAFANAHNLTHLLKTGWSYFQENTGSTSPKSNLLQFSTKK